MNVLPGALLGVVGGAGVLKGSKLTGSKSSGISSFVGRGTWGACEKLLVRLINKMMSVLIW
jgi:hypothetical protein